MLEDLLPRFPSSDLAFYKSTVTHYTFNGVGRRFSLLLCRSGCGQGQRILAALFGEDGLGTPSITPTSLTSLPSRCMRMCSARVLPADRFRSADHPQEQDSVDAQDMDVLLRRHQQRQSDISDNRTHAAMNAMDAMKALILADVPPQTVNKLTAVFRGNAGAPCLQPGGGRRSVQCADRYKRRPAKALRDAKGAAGQSCGTGSLELASRPDRSATTRARPSIRPAWSSRRCMRR